MNRANAAPLNARPVVGDQLHRNQLAAAVAWEKLGEVRPSRVWFSMIERQAIHRGSFTSVRELNTKIRAFINGWNDRCHPFCWTKTADRILRKANRQNTSNAGTRRIGMEEAFADQPV